MGCATSAGQTRDRSRVLPAVSFLINPGPQSVVTSYYFSDFDGNVDALVSPSGMILAQYEYDPFGNLSAKGGLMAELNKYRFSSKEWEQNAGLYYYLYRFFDPNLQRWPNQDPVRERGFVQMHSDLNQLQNIYESSRINPTIQTLALQAQAEDEIRSLLQPAELLEGPNLYTFVRNQPITFVDADGLKLTLCDCQNFYKQALGEAGEEAGLYGLRDIIIIGGATTGGLLTGGWGGVAIIGVGDGIGVIDSGGTIGNVYNQLQNAGHLYSLCLQAVADQK
jgi:RHS repeat-associated protein